MRLDGPSLDHGPRLIIVYNHQMRSVVVGHTAFTVAMFGLMWAVQIVVYPQFRSVAPAEFANYAADHGARITTALALLAPAEIVFAGWLFLDTPAGLSRSAVFVSGTLLAAGWLATAFFFAPLHGKFQGPYNRDLIEQLISTNWLRTALWSGRAVMASWFLWQLLDADT